MSLVLYETIPIIKADEEKKLKLPDVPDRYSAGVEELMKYLADPDMAGMRPFIGEDRGFYGLRNEGDNRSLYRFVNGPEGRGMMMIGSVPEALFTPLGETKDLNLGIPTWKQMFESGAIPYPEDMFDAIEEGEGDQKTTRYALKNPIFESLYDAPYVRSGFDATEYADIFKKLEQMKEEAEKQAYEEAVNQSITNKINSKFNWANNVDSEIKDTPIPKKPREKEPPKPLSKYDIAVQPTRQRKNVKSEMNTEPVSEKVVIDRAVRNAANPDFKNKDIFSEEQKAITGNGTYINPEYAHYYDENAKENHTKAYDAMRVRKDKERQAYEDKTRDKYKAQAKAKLKEYEEERKKKEEKKTSSNEST